MGTQAATSAVRTCNDCGYDMPLSRTSCPHCGRPQHFPNVSLATVLAEKEKLQTRFKQAVAKSKAAGTNHTLEKFRVACNRSKAVFNCDPVKLNREVASGTQVFEHYSDLERLRLRTAVPDKFDWQRLRPQAEIELFGSAEHLDKLHYACLSLDGTGLISYGECTVQLSERMIAHRTSCFEGNSAVRYKNERTFTKALRSSWDERHLICVAAFSERLGIKTQEAHFQGVVLSVGAKPEDDRFIEAHVFGPITVRTFEHVGLKKKGSTVGRGYLMAIREVLDLHRIPHN